nr:Spf1 [Starmerella bombicola]
MLVEAPYIREAALRDPLPLILRPYGAVFSVLYGFLLRKYNNEYASFFGSSEWTFLFFGGVASLQVLLWLLPFWNVRLREVFETKAPSNAESASLIKVVPTAGNGAAEFVHVVRSPDGSRGFIFQQRRFIWHPEFKQFRPPHFWVDDKGVTVGALLASEGNSGDLIEKQREFGPNIFDIPVPTFLELWKEHAVAPFFVFQIFSCCLWFLDEMWKSSMMMLFMLVSFESTVVYQRQRTMTEFRSMSLKPYAVQVFRNGKWSEVQTPELLPGDLVSVLRSKEDSGLACDLVLLSGTCVVNEAMLSGESTPLLKEGINEREKSAELDLDGVDKISLLAGGTKAIQVSAGESAVTGKTPDGGALAVVARTGFETTQGQLVRTMIFSAEPVGSGSKEAYFFILFLLIFAVAASYYVWVKGHEIGRKQSKLLLDCVIIITSVVPPELPMELTLAVNNSLGALSKFFIYCTEPFRLPFAGRIDVCCFDKTGTLTEEDLVVEGGDICDGEGLKAIDKMGGTAETTIASAHALVLLEDGEIVGDPMEQTTLTALGWTVRSNDEVVSSNGKSRLRIIKRFPFSSALKRSSSVAKIGNDHFVSVKGAPETIERMLIDVPPSYRQTFTAYTKNGSRVLAFAYKQVKAPKGEFTREKAEKDLVFAGFVVYTSPLKKDAIAAIQMLNESSHRSVMITGDNPLTAVKVARDVGIVERETLVLDVDANGELMWTSVETDESKSYSTASVELYENYDLCMTGAALARIEHAAPLVQLIRHTWVYARVSPAQKEFVLKTLKDEGYMTLMCGDGTNDVGALKQAHIGVALLNGTSEGMAKLAEQNKIKQVTAVYEKQRAMMEKWAPGKVPPVPLPIAHLYPPGPTNPHYLKAIEAKGGTVDDKTKLEILEASRTAQNTTQAAGLADRMTQMLEDQDEGDAPQLKLGDASCAAPLTSKLRDVDAVVKIIRQGRCTLVTTIQMYKILALNCLVSAYTLSVLFLAGIKMGDGQSVASGLLLSMCSMSVSRGRVCEKLSKERPQPGIFNKYIMGSILGQFAVHITTLVIVRQWVHEFEPPRVIDLDKKFEPSLLNTAMYLLQIVQEISTFAVNYQGRPFREAISENKGMYYGILGCLGLAFSGATEFFPELNEALSLVPMPTSFKTRLTAIMLADLGLCYVIERGLKYLFSDYKPKNIAVRLEERGAAKVQLSA